MASMDLPTHRVVFLVGTSQFYQLVKEVGWQQQSPSNNCFHILPLAPKVTDNSGDCYGIEGSWKDHFISLRRQLPCTGIRCCSQAQCQSEEGVSETYFLPLRLLIVFPYCNRYTDPLSDSFFFFYVIGTIFRKPYMFINCCSFEKLYVSQLGAYC